jgi:hypothetical protein
MKEKGPFQRGQLVPSFRPHCDPEATVAEVGLEERPHQGSITLPALASSNTGDLRPSYNTPMLGTQKPRREPSAAT